ncbi:MAG: hypothetical protein E5299_00408 [Burkholderia gladioli]|nr:MAG: hypothetical protein E5299_00408 [Burkholderia gladioli]
MPECATPLLSVKTVYRLTLRAFSGFAQSLPDLAFPSLPVLNYTRLCRRAKTFDVELLLLRDSEPIHLVDDSTSLPGRCCINRAKPLTFTRNGRGASLLSSQIPE